MSLAEQITRAYSGNWNAGAGQGNIPGEGHSKADRSVTVKDAPDRPEGILVCVRGSGDWRSEMDRFRRDGHLPAFEPQQTNGADNGRKSDWRCTGTYEYDDGAGGTIYRTRRLEKTGEKKRFVAERIEAGRWINGLGDVRRVPYRFTEVRKALESAVLAGKPFPLIYFVEGERKADKLASMGFIATAIAFGANGWKPEYADIPAFADAPVIILPDNDDKGREFAAKVKAEIDVAGGTAHILDLPNLPIKGDIIDWTGSADDLRKLTESAIKGSPQTLPLADLALWATTSPKPKPFAMAGRIPDREVTLLTSVGGGTKSTFGHQLSVCMAAGRQMIGTDVHPGPAIYVTAEDDFERLHWMHEHICRAVDVRQEDLFGKIHLSSVRGSGNNELATFDMQGRVQPTPAFTTLRATLVSTGAKFLVLDNVAHMFAGNENDRVQVTAFVNLLYSLCRDLGVTILLIAHPNKAGDSWSGSTAWQNAVRSHLVIEKPEGSTSTHDRMLRVEKANYAKPGEELRFVWHDFALWRESDLPDETRAEMDEIIRANGENAAFLRCLAVATESRRAVSHHKGTNYFGTAFTAMPEGKGYKLQAFQSAFERLLHIGEIELDQQLWKRDNRTWKYGIKAAEKRTDPPAPTPRTDPHRPLAETPGNACTDLHAPTPLYTTYNGAAPLGSAAPVDDEFGWPVDGGE